MPKLWQFSNDVGGLRASVHRQRLEKRWGPNHETDSRDGRTCRRRLPGAGRSRSRPGPPVRRAHVDTVL
ncbi:hypothetical protein CN934_33035, partial [Ensifer sp. MMN_5]